MQVSHTVKLPGSVQFEMKYFTFVVDYDDMPEGLHSQCTMVEIWRIMEFVVQRELINLQLQSGYMAYEEAQGRMEYLRQCLGPLSEKLAPNGL
jgi:hypothetical protein